MMETNDIRSLEPLLPVSILDRHLSALGRSYTYSTSRYSKRCGCTQALLKGRQADQRVCLRPSEHHSERAHPSAQRHLGVCYCPWSLGRHLHATLLHLPTSIIAVVFALSQEWSLSAKTQASAFTLALSFLTICGT